MLRRNDRLYGKREMSADLHRPRHELFDLQADPHEIYNQADDPRQKQTLDDLQPVAGVAKCVLTIRGTQAGT